jgi:nucleotide-binding universal stress UspA family protein
VLVPVDAAGESERAVDVACQLVREHGSAVVAITVVEVPLDLPLDVPLAEDEARAHEALATARAIGDSYGVTVRGRIVRARQAGPAVVDEVQRAGSDLVVLAAPRCVRRRNRHTIAFGTTAQFVLRNAPCRVLVVGATPAPG